MTRLFLLSSLKGCLTSFWPVIKFLVSLSFMACYKTCFGVGLELLSLLFCQFCFITEGRTFLGSLLHALGIECILCDLSSVCFVSCSFMALQQFPPSCSFLCLMEPHCVHVLLSIQQQTQEYPSQNFGSLSLQSYLSPLVFCPLNLNVSVFLKSNLSPQFNEMAVLCLNFLFLHHGGESVSSKKLG